MDICFWTDALVLQFHVRQNYAPLGGCGRVRPFRQAEGTEGRLQAVAGSEAVFDAEGIGGGVVLKRGV